MASINSIILEGHLVRKAHFKTSERGTPICSFTIANSRFFTRNGILRQETSFFDVETWAELADTCAALGEKGVPVRIVGRIKQYRWKANDGSTRSAIRIIAEHVEFRCRKDLENEIDDLVEENEPNEAEVREKHIYAQSAVDA